MLYGGAPDARNARPRGTVAVTFPVLSPVSCGPRGFGFKCANGVLKSALQKTREAYLNIRGRVGQPQSAGFQEFFSCLLILRLLQKGVTDVVMIGVKITAPLGSSSAAL